MSDIPESLQYSAHHVWVENRHDGLLRVGITEYAQQELGEIVFIELPETGRGLARNQECATLESVKTTVEIHCPVASEVIDTNQELEEYPELINIDPYGDGWLLLLRPEETAAQETLVGAREYATMINKDSKGELYGNSDFKRQ